MYKTKDLYTAAVFEVMGYKHIRLEPYGDGKSKLFVYKTEDEEVLEEIEKKYLRQELRLEPYFLFYTAKRLKTAVSPPKFFKREGFRREAVRKYEWK
jgi:hypothetical protein